MEEKQVDWKAIGTGILTALIPSLILLIINSSIYLFQKEKVAISISSSIYIDNQYITTINIKNYQNNKSISEINLWTKDIKVNKIQANIVNAYDKSIDNIKLKDIVPNYNGVIVIYSDSEINNENLSIELDEKVNVEFLAMQKESSYIKIKEYLIVVLIYFIEFSIVAVIYRINLNKEKKIVDDEYKKINERLKTQENRIEKLFKSEKDIRIKLQKRIIHYSKELDFWKNTIRKMLYNLNKKEANADEIFNAVTSSLKTYQTLEKIDYKEVEEIIEDLKDEKENI